MGGAAKVGLKHSLKNCTITEIAFTIVAVLAGNFTWNPEKNMTVMIAAEGGQLSLIPRNPLGARLCETFCYRWHTISAENVSAPEWTTNTKYPLRPRVLWQIWNDPTTLIGVRFGSTTTYALIDLDCTSQYHPIRNPDGLKLLFAALETIGIVRSVLVRSSHSGGLHLYLPLPYAVPTFGLAQALKQCLEAQGIAIAAGQVEIFPNTKAYALPGTYIEYNAHRLPLQPDSGSCLLDADGNPQGNDLGQFFRHWDSAAAGQDLETLHEAIVIARRNSSKRKRHRIAPVEEWRADLQTEIAEGWTGQGQTNHLLKTIACYGVVFERLSGDALAAFVETSAVNAPGYEAYCQHQHEITKRSIVWARAAEQYWWALGSAHLRTSTAYGDLETGSNVIPINRNQARAEDAQRRIREAVARLQAAEQLPAEITSRVQVLIRTAQTSLQTLYRNRDLWHPNHLKDEAAEGVITDETDDLSLSSIETGDPQETPKLSESEKLHTERENMKCRLVLAPDRSLALPIPSVDGLTLTELRGLDRTESLFPELSLEKPCALMRLTDEHIRQET